MSVEAVRAKYEANLRSIPGVVGVGSTADRIMVYVVDESVIRLVPSSLDGVPVQVNVSGRVGIL